MKQFFICRREEQLASLTKYWSLGCPSFVLGSHNDLSQLSNMMTYLTYYLSLYWRTISDKKAWKKWSEEDMFLDKAQTFSWCLSRYWQMMEDEIFLCHLIKIFQSCRLRLKCFQLQLSKASRTDYIDDWNMLFVTACVMQYPFKCKASIHYLPSFKERGDRTSMRRKA